MKTASISFQDEDRRRFVVKFYRPERWSVDQIREEHQFALELVKDGGSGCRSARV
ncbi:YihE protein a ser/thr kinase implicated inLPS synthesis and Cpx signaling [Salmonella enterica subsp. enterica]|uniref:YihE protein a ser/thr kinase implicated inLPS synthesis and Cpx signaling n=1 Tax=Salmonella enterica I TaxID=59201 RepID=A0A379X5B0_SALET|nr:YihE protein a ser/thr kinase implicated inLPS synthesis and Cpx signaling [Salmonella enterica subsp. enterica]